MCTCQTRTHQRRRQLVLWSVVAILIATQPVSSMANEAGDHEEPTVVVRVDNLVAASARNLEVAETRAAEVFARAGATVRWMDEDATVRDRIRPPFTIVLVRGNTNARAPFLGDDALGFADVLVRRAHVFVDRIEALNARSMRSPASIMGDVMAHELGHLLLSRPGHSVDGIMRSSVETRVRALDTFTHAQAREILGNLRQVPRLLSAEAIGADRPSVISITPPR